ncbi:MAG: methylated-DNA--[protein]-cysteine S-methyltransferase [Ignavibacteriae bacterium]|nr:methylated-DNA--[protein]-cysteine S-methyltransferase [Ignavibacteriota bacterium]
MEKPNVRSRSADSYRRIWATVQRIPRGRVATYGQIARLSKIPGRARLVGYALHSLPYGIEVPWQRVINSQGKISFLEHSRSYQRQLALLVKEGILFKNGRIDLKRFGWKK